MRHAAYMLAPQLGAPSLGAPQLGAPAPQLGSPSIGDVAKATLTIGQLLLFAAAGASLGGVIATQQSEPKPYARNAMIGAVALPLIAVVL
jgi:hypothetical protein